MPVELKKEIRKRLAHQFGVTQKEFRKAEAECDGGLCLVRNERGVLEAFYILHVPIRGKIAPTLFPLHYFVGHSEGEGGDKCQ